LTISIVTTLAADKALHLQAF